VVLPASSSRRKALPGGPAPATACLDFLFSRAAIANRSLVQREKPISFNAGCAAPPNWRRPLLARIGWVPSYQNPENPGAAPTSGLTKDAVAAIAKKRGDGNRHFRSSALPNVNDAPVLDHAALNTPKNAPLLLALSRLHPAKGIDTC